MLRSGAWLTRSVSKIEILFRKLDAQSEIPPAPHCRTMPRPGRQHAHTARAAKDEIICGFRLCGHVKHSTFFDSSVKMIVFCSATVLPCSPSSVANGIWAPMATIVIYD